ncbi:hypothetical protein NOS3756_53620 [Nostoc sp. NIES-3756]|jgi:hypothetical protein|uniref:hypothetical protein n=1 Tax=Nostoc sp. NIES-3756 TaxID=1751286 RepID=UPI000721EB7B|nr:hypothetical protein [Nostoc sp. NIES-3756]BAT56357.1 hypothetical protein NOS3756_53620 [Nostoc sp. NIES-3756]
MYQNHRLVQISEATDQFLEEKAIMVAIAFTFESSDAYALDRLLNLYTDFKFLQDMEKSSLQISRKT